MSNLHLEIFDVNINDLRTVPDLYHLPLTGLSLSKNIPPIFVLDSLQAMDENTAQHG